MIRSIHLTLLVFLLAWTGTAQAYFVTLTWTAPGDDGSLGTASYYDIRYSESVITESNWSRATRAGYLPTPGRAGQQQYFVVTDLPPGRSYYFAIKTADERFNWSPLSNVVVKTTPEQCCFGTTGNVDCDPNDLVDLGDLTVLISYLFVESKPLCCPDEANIDGDPFGAVDLGDLTHLIIHLFSVPLDQPPCR